MSTNRGMDEEDVKYTYSGIVLSHRKGGRWVIWRDVDAPIEVAQSCPTLCDPWTVAHQAPPPMGFSRQEYWSGLLFLLQSESERETQIP